MLDELGRAILAEGPAHRHWVQRRTIAIMRLLEPVVHVEMMSKEHSVARVDDDTLMDSASALGLRLGALLDRTRMLWSRPHMPSFGNAMERRDSSLLADLSRRSAGRFQCRK